MKHLLSQSWKRSRKNGGAAYPVSVKGKAGNATLFFT